MNETITVNMNNLTDSEREQLMHLIEKSSKKTSKMWKPELGDQFYIILSNGDVFKQAWDGGPNDEHFYLIGNIFRTKEEAKEEVERIKLLTQWKQLSIESGEDENPWGKNSRHYFAYYSYNSSSISFDFAECCRSNRIYFPSMESLKKAIQIVGYENVKKYILGIEESAENNNLIIE